MHSRYIEKIRPSITIKTSRKTSQLLNGLHRSIYKGKSLDFDNLRDYTIYDDIRDVDWKSSIRHGGLLVRQYIAERRHNILFVIDSGVSMQGETAMNEEKSEVALLSVGALAFLSGENGDSVGFLSADGNKMQFEKFRNGSGFIDVALQRIEKYINKDSKYSANDLLDYVNAHIKHKTIIFVVTDLGGIEKIQEQTIRKTTLNHELFFLNIGDASICEDDAYDLDNKKYIPKFLSHSKRLQQIEKEERETIEKNQSALFKKYCVFMTTINGQTEVVPKIIDLLERHNHAIGTN